MPLDPAIVDPMIGPFKNMLAEVEEKGLTGGDVDEMRKWLGHMETLAAEMDDIAAYSGQLAQDQAFQKFSDAYSRALASEAKENTKDMSDEDLLEQSMGAYEQALETYKSGQGGESGELLIPAIERILEIGNSGVTFPVFMRMLEEEGLNRALEGAAPANKAAMEQDVQFAKEAWLPRQIEMREEILALFEELVASSAFGQPDPLELEIGRERIQWEYAPKHTLWTAIVRRWEFLLDDLVDWVDSYCAFAPYDERWKLPGSSAETALRNVRREQQTGPARMQYHLRVLKKYFGLRFRDIFEDETFAWEWTARRVTLTEARLQLAIETWAQCRQGCAPSQDLVDRATELHNNGGDHRENPRQAPPLDTPVDAPELDWSALKPHEAREQSPDIGWIEEPSEDEEGEEGEAVEEGDAAEEAPAT